MGSARDALLVIFLSSSWPSPLSCFCETFAASLDISKAFDRVWHKALLSKLPSYGFYPVLCSFLSSFLSGRCISAVVDGHCSTSKPINSGVPQSSVLHPLSPSYLTWLWIHLYFLLEQFLYPTYSTLLYFFAGSWITLYPFDNYPFSIFFFFLFPNLFTPPGGKKETSRRKGWSYRNIPDL